MTPTLLVLALLTAQEPSHKTFDVGGVKREAIVYAPSKKPAGKPAVVFDFHGHGGTMRHAARAHKIHEVCPEAVVVYMQGLNTPGKITDPEGKKSGWQSTPGDQKDRDLLFFDAVLASVKKDHGIDEKRVFATGHSNGAAFSYLLWAKRPEAVAAIAPVAGAAGLYLLKAAPKPVLHIAGKADPLVTFAMQERTMTAVKRLNGCEGEGETWQKTAKRFTSKKGGTTVWCVHEGKHEYPAFAPEMIAAFFREVGK